MKIITSKNILLSIVMLSFFSTNITFAENQYINASGGESNATLSLQKEANDTAPEIIIPDKDDDDITRETGDLTIDYLPDFIFKLTRIENGIGYYDMSLPENESTFIQVSDRSGTGDGWTLNLKINPFVGSKGSTLKEGELIFHEIIMKKRNESVGIKPNSNKDIIFQLSKPLETKTMITAQKNEGQGSWAGLFEKNNKGLVSMKIPLKGVVTDKYTSVLLWELNSAPVN